MRAVVDTNVVAYLLLRSQPFADEAHGFWQAVTEPLAPALWEAELANVVWMAVRAGIVTLDEGLRRLELAGRLGIQSVPSRRLWHGALRHAVASGAAAYDTLFIELASREHLPLATFDSKLLKAFPGIAVRPGGLVDNS